QREAGSQLEAPEGPHPIRVTRGFFIRFVGCVGDAGLQERHRSHERGDEQESRKALAQHVVGLPWRGVPWNSPELGACFSGLGAHDGERLSEKCKRGRMAFDGVVLVRIACPGTHLPGKTGGESQTPTTTRLPSQPKKL